MFMVDDQALRRAAARYAVVLEQAGGDLDAILAGERIDGDAASMCLGDLARLRGYDPGSHASCLFEGFLLGVLAGRRESAVEGSLL